MQFDPLEDRVLIRPKKQTELQTTDGGLIVPLTVKKEINEGEVVAVGQGFTARDTGLFVPTILHKGDLVLYGIHAGMPIEVENGNGKEECLLMREGDVLMLIKKAEQTKEI